MSLERDTGGPLSSFVPIGTFPVSIDNFTSYVYDLKDLNTALMPSADKLFRHYGDRDPAWTDDIPRNKDICSQSRPFNWKCCARCSVE